ncbi:hypothetical protein BKA82DRAFT_4019270 [Pisolithus tinctorius]|nr:hypothetical protein BKA82DRAFT_4019270 [Pisolithus tinctorius]
MSSRPRLDPEGTTAKLNESLHCALPPICATTKYHHSVWTLGPYVTPTPNAESILSAFNTPFNSHELECLTIHSRVEGQVLFILNGEQVHCWDFTGVHDKYKWVLLSLEVQSTYERLGEATGVRGTVMRFTGDRWSFEAIEVIQRRRDEGDSWKPSLYDRVQEHMRQDRGLSMQNYAVWYNSLTTSGEIWYGTRED